MLHPTPKNETLHRGQVREAVVSRQKILIVEDNEDNHHILVYRLRKSGDFKIREAGHGQEALDLHSPEPPDLIFLDLKLPVLDGGETARQIRQLQGPGCKIPIIASTAQAVVGDEQKALAAGCDDDIAKPIIGGNLVKEKIERLLTQGRHRKAD